MLEQTASAANGGRGTRAADPVAGWGRLWYNLEYDCLNYWWRTPIDHHRELPTDEVSMRVWNRPHRSGAGPRLFGATLLLTTAAVVFAGPAMAVGQVGEPAADFTLESSTYQTHTLSDYLGEVVLLFMVGYG
jgi:hypothetical protein